jgi:hypothetical protein
MAVESRPDTRIATRRRTIGKRKKGGGAGAAIGAAIVGFEQAVFRKLPPPHEMVHDARPDEPVPTGDGRFLINLPDAPAQPADKPETSPE